MRSIIDRLSVARMTRLGAASHELCGFPPAGPAHPNFDACFVFLAQDGLRAAPAAIVAACLCP